MKTQRGKAGPPRMTARERRHYLAGVPTNTANPKALRIAVGRTPLSARVRGVLIETAKGKK